MTFASTSFSLPNLFKMMRKRSPTIITIPIKRKIVLICRYLACPRRQSSPLLMSHNPCTLNDANPESIYRRPFSCLYNQQFHTYTLYYIFNCANIVKFMLNTKLYYIITLQPPNVLTRTEKVTFLKCG